MRYGRHDPNGTAAVEYILGASGMWKEIKPAEYIWNYYPDCATPNHPYNQNELIAAANGARFFTARDANCHLLLDWNQDGEIDTTSGGYAFHEHNGKGISGQSMGAPFTLFWFDDNWLARYMTEAYGRPAPNGLSGYTDFNRWKILGWDPSNWQPYKESNLIDQLALNGVYALATQNISGALEKWDRILFLSGFTYDADNQRYTYDNITESYHLGLFEILTGFLMDQPGLESSKRQELLSHWVSLRSNILSNQERSGSSLYGWRSELKKSDTLINTESIAANVLGLGAGALHVYEAGQAPLQMSSNNYFVRPHHVLSAVLGESTPGFMTNGPQQNFDLGTYQVDFFLRAPAPAGSMATLTIVDAQNNQVLAAQDILAKSMIPGNDWTRITLEISVTNPSNRLAFQTYWYGTANLDIAAIRVRKP